MVYQEITSDYSEYLKKLDRELKRRIPEQKKRQRKIKCFLCGEVTEIGASCNC
jgi:hypothetical protein